MNTNRIAVPGSLSLATKIRMSCQGIVINLYVAVGTAALFLATTFIFFPPKKIQFELSNELQIGAKWSVQNYLSANGFSSVLKPPELADMENVPAKLQPLLKAELNKTELKYWHQYYLYLYSFIAGFFVGLLGMTWLSNRETKHRSEDQFVRGAKLITARKLNKQTTKKGGRFSIGGVRLPVHTEILPKIYVGRPQQGKSTAIKFDIDQHRKQNVGRHVILCTKGDFSDTHFRKNIDISFSPGVDKNTLRWSLFADLTDPSQISAYAEALIPAASGNGQVFVQGARLIFEGILLYCLQSGKTTNSALWDVCCEPLSKLSTILEETPGAEQGAALIADPTEQPAPSYHSNLMAYVKPLSILAKLDGDFSAKKWLESGTGDLFVAARPDKLATMAPLLSLFLHTLLEAHMGLRDDRERRIWYVLDELTVVPKVPALDRAANFGPSKGLCLTLGMQSYFQLDNLYTQPVRKSLVSSAGTHIFYSVGDPSMSKEASAIIGSADYIVNRQTISTGVQDSRDGGNSSDQDASKAAATPDEIMGLQPLHAYLKIMGYSAAPIELKYIAYQTINTIEPDPQFGLQCWLQSFVDKKNGGSSPEQVTVPTAKAEETPLPENNYFS